MIVERLLNAELPYVPWMTGYLAILVGALMTFLLQSSSIFTSSLTPLVGLGLISVDRVYPLTLGSNLGTTTTALLAALAAEGSRMRPAIQIALVHLFFNLSGILLFYPIPFTRLPVRMAKALGRITARYRWFAVAYMVLIFVVLPVLVFTVSLGGAIALYSTFVPVALITVAVTFINVCQKKYPSILPPPLRTWEWLPECLRSLDPIDRLIMSLVCCNRSKAPPTYSPVAMQPTPPLERSASKIGEGADLGHLQPLQIVIQSESAT